MRNKIIIIFLSLIFNSTYLNFSMAEEFIFKVTDLEILENNTVYKGNNRGKIITDTQVELISDNFEYLKKINRLEANGNVQLTDKKSNIIINAEKMFYLKSEEIIYTLGKTLINVDGKYNVEGYDLTFFKGKKILSSKKNAIITDSELNKYELDQFHYSIDREILKGENIISITTDKENKSDEYFFKSGFFDLKNNKFLGKDVVTKFHKDLFGYDDNDPRLNSASAFGDEYNTYFKKGVFTSCKKTDKCPPWKISSNQIHHDKIKKQIVYKNAWLELYDFPVVYFPKFFHPGPTVERQSGFLKPEFGSSNNLGSSIYAPYFLLISEDRDLTIKPRLFDNNKYLIQSEYRQKTKNSVTIADFGFLNGHKSNAQDKAVNRSHLFTNTLVDLSLKKFNRSMLQINFQKTSNDNYLKLFDLQSPLPLDNSVLESKIELDLGHDKYDLITSFEMYETLTGTNNDRYQYVLPNYNFSRNFNSKTSNGWFNFNSSGSNMLNNTNVITSSVINDLKYTASNNISDNGIKTNFNILLKNINSVGKNTTIYKNSPQSELMSSYAYNASLPLSKKTPRTFNTLEPKLSLRFSPHEMKNNTDTGRRIDVNNIFLSDRLNLDNSLETGESITLGLNFTKEKINEVNEIEEFIDFKLASVFRLDEEKDIPINSTLNKKNSNIFGQINFKPNQDISLGYNFSLSNDLNTLEYNSLISDITYKNFNTQFSYLEERGVIGKSHTIENTTTFNFDDQNAISFNTRINREIDLTEYYDLVYEYKNDCLVASMRYKKNYYSDADIKPVEELFFSITIVPLGTFSPDKMVLK
jgi:LPS-assembly protein